MLAEFNIAPLGMAEGLSKYVAEVIEIIKKSGLDYQLNAMGTIIEGDADEVFELIKTCHQHLAAKASRVYTVIKIDDKVGKKGQLKYKTQAVKKHIDEDINSAD